MIWICVDCDVTAVFEAGVPKVCIYCGEHMKPKVDDGKVEA